MSTKPRGAWSLVLIPALISLVVTVVRLLGELNGWNEALFRRDGPGPDSRQGLLGITLLVPIFGFWFGWRLRRDTAGPAHAGKAALLYLLGGGLLIGGFLLAQTAGLITLPTADAPGVPTGLPWSVGVVVASGLVLFTAWPRLSGVLLLYAALARIPVIAITYIAVANDWGTHYEKLPPNFVLPEGTDKATFLVLPQVTFWIVATMFVGGLTGCLAAALARRKG